MAVQTKYLITHKKSLNIAISGLSAGGMSKFLSDFGFTHLITWDSNGVTMPVHFRHKNKAKSKLNSS
jgi:hypothetical protein|tara:strand:+ start:557 stop:757 length:201 start_codon:yes stop_codon:yes gene_type:complete